MQAVVLEQPPFACFPARHHPTVIGKELGGRDRLPSASQGAVATPHFQPTFVMVNPL